jgi:hypothetical protein
MFSSKNSRDTGQNIILGATALLLLALQHNASHAEVIRDWCDVDTITVSLKGVAVTCKNEIFIVEDSAGAGPLTRKQVKGFAMKWGSQDYKPAADFYGLTTYEGGDLFVTYDHRSAISMNDCRNRLCRIAISWEKTRNQYKPDSVTHRIRP